jgi:hypothetical protein
MSPAPFWDEMLYFWSYHILKTYLSKVVPISCCSFSEFGTFDGCFLDFLAHVYLQNNEKLKSVSI